MTARTIVGLTIAFLVSMSAGPALAAGGTLEPFPDLVTECLNGNCEVAENPLGALTGSLLIQMIVAFVLLIPLANAVVFKPLVAVLDEREARIAGASGQAKDVTTRADSVFGRYQEAVTAARHDADESRRETLDAARKSQSDVTAAARTDAEQKVAEVRSEVAASADEARGQLRSESDALARTVAAQVLGRAL
jgi:F-type H+-transporting ATPase subunit b